MSVSPALAVLTCALHASTVLAARGQMSEEGRRSIGGHAGLDELRRPRHGDFGYEGDKGHDKWPSLFPSCGGGSQSPVNLPLSETQHVKYRTQLIVPDFQWAPSQVKILNNGHTAQLVPVNLDSMKDRVLRGGPLMGEYVLVQLHFHWGENDEVGSEHAIDGKYYAMEMHMVFERKSKRNQRTSYRTHDDVAVVAIFLKLSSRNNPSLVPIVLDLPKVEEVNAEAPLQQKLSTANLLPCLGCGYLVYNGSLTTPPCSEPVTWILYNTPISVSSQQVAEFRKLKSSAGTLTWNRRPVQPLNGRTVYSAAPQYERRWPKSLLLLLLLL